MAQNAYPIFAVAPVPGVTATAPFPTPGGNLSPDSAALFEWGAGFNTGVTADAMALRDWLNFEFGIIAKAIPLRITTTKAASYTLLTTDDVVLVDCTAGSVTITFPDPTRYAQGTWTVKKIDATANTVTCSAVIASTGAAATFDGAASVTISKQYDARVIRSNGSQYYGLSSGSASGALGHTLTFGTHLTGGSFDGSADVTLATDAVSTNTVSTIVARDGSGNFAAGTITAALAGNATTATTLQNTRTIWGQNFNGSANVSGALSGATTGVFSGTLTVQTATVGLGLNADNQSMAVGIGALGATTAGIQNTALGSPALSRLTSGSHNTAVGYFALDNDSTGADNTAVGHFALNAATGATNTAVGRACLYSNSSGSGNVALGYCAGAYELGSNAFYVDNQDRTNTAGDKAKALLYGVFNATASSQTLTVNAVLNTPYAFTCAALTATTGSFSGLLSLGTPATSGQILVLDAVDTNVATSQDRRARFVVKNGANYYGAELYGGLDAGGSAFGALGGYNASATSALILKWTDTSATFGSIPVTMGALTATTGTFSGLTQANAGLIIAGGSGNAAGKFYATAASGLIMTGITGSSDDITLLTPGLSTVFHVPTGTNNITFNGAVVTGGTLQIGSRGVFAAGDKYLIVDASGNVHVSALGPAS